MEEEEIYRLERQRMVETQLVSRDIHDSRVLQAMRSVPRHLFVAPEFRSMAYSDGPLPIGSGQTISQPYIVALMTQLLGLRGGEVVLEVGAGSGYQAAILSKVAKKVYSIERHSELVNNALETLSMLGITNVEIHHGDGTLGLPEFAPYQGILVTAAAPKVPGALLQQLDDGCKLVIPVGGRFGQFLERWERKGGQYKSDGLVPVAFVPLVGKDGWSE